MLTRCRCAHPLCDLEIYGLDLDVIDDISVLDTASWTLSVPTVPFDLTQLKIKIKTNPVTYQQSYLELISDCRLYQNIFTHHHDSKTNDGDAAAEVSHRNYSIRSRMPVVSLATAPFTQLNSELFF